MNKTQVYVFDLDDTLILEEDYLKSGFQHVDHFLRQQHGLSGFYEKALDLHHSRFKGYVLNEALAQLAGPPSTEILTQVYHEFWNHPPRIGLQPDAQQLLSYLKRHHIPAAIISDGPLVCQENKVKAVNLEAWTSKIILTDAYGRDYWKPHPRAYLEIEAFFSKPPDAFVYIADNPLKDFVTPRQQGWWTVQIKRSKGLCQGENLPPEHQAHQIITCLLELLPRTP